MNHLYGLTEDELMQLDATDLDNYHYYPNDPIDWDAELQFDCDGDICIAEADQEKGVKRKAEGKPRGERGAKRRELSPEFQAIVPNVSEMPVGFGRCPRPTEAEVTSERLYNCSGDTQSKSY